MAPLIKPGKTFNPPFPALEPRVTQPSFHNPLYSALPLNTLNELRMNVHWGDMRDWQSQAVHNHHAKQLRGITVDRAATHQAAHQIPMRGFNPKSRK
jgi:hypothetical protein